MFVPRNNSHSAPPVGTMSYSKPEPLHLRGRLPDGITLPPFTTKALPIPEHKVMTEEDEEDSRRRSQAQLAKRLKIRTACRLLGVTEDISSQKSPFEARRQLSRANILKQQSLYPKPENNWLLKVGFIFLSLGEERVIGTLEACRSGFTFRASHWSLSFKDTNVKLYFFRRADKRFPHILQFHLYSPIEVGSRKTNNILFFLEDIIGDTSSCFTDLENFIAGVPRAQWDSSQFNFFQVQKLDDFQFDGVIPLDQGRHAKSGKGGSEWQPVSVALTFRALVLLRKMPFDVVPLIDVEIVNLAKDASGKILMTVVFRDFKREVLQIHGIALEMLASIKRLLHIGDVKYYCNSLFLDWNSKLKVILEFPERFVQSGGWESLHLEDKRTLSYYKIADEPVGCVRRFQ